MGISKTNFTFAGLFNHGHCVATHIECHCTLQLTLGCWEVEVSSGNVYKPRAFDIAAALAHLKQ